MFPQYLSLKPDCPSLTLNVEHLAKVFLSLWPLHSLYLDNAEYILCDLFIYVDIYIYIYIYMKKPVCT